MNNVQHGNATTMLKFNTGQCHYRALQCHSIFTYFGNCGFQNRQYNFRIYTFNYRTDVAFMIKVAETVAGRNQFADDKTTDNNTDHSFNTALTMT